jgi:hypothetical protein
MKHRRFPPPQIAEAVFRGKNSTYNFEVYPLNIKFNEVPAIYLITRRKIGKDGRGHHALVWMGQTESLFTDVKTKRQGSWVKKRDANTVCVLIEDDPKKRAEVETDLKTAFEIRTVRAQTEPVTPPAQDKMKLSLRRPNPVGNGSVRSAVQPKIAPEKQKSAPVKRTKKTEPEISKPRAKKKTKVTALKKKLTPIEPVIGPKQKPNAKKTQAQHARKNPIASNARKTRASTKKGTKTKLEKLAPAKLVKAGSQSAPKKVASPKPAGSVKHKTGPAKVTPAKTKPSAKTTQRQKTRQTPPADRKKKTTRNATIVPLKAGDAKEKTSKAEKGKPATAKPAKTAGLNRQPARSAKPKVTIPKALVVSKPKPTKPSKTESKLSKPKKRVGR